MEAEEGHEVQRVTDRHGFVRPRVGPGETEKDRKQPQRYGRKQD
jgi:hypothetical protein